MKSSIKLSRLKPRSRRGVRSSTAAALTRLPAEERLPPSRRTGFLSDGRTGAVDRPRAARPAQKTSANAVDLETVSATRLPRAPAAPLRQGSIFERWDLTEEELTGLVDRNPGLRGIMYGHVAILQLLKQLLRVADLVKDIGKVDKEHERGTLGDLIIAYRGHRIKVKTRSVQTGYIRRWTEPQTGDELLIGRALVEGSHRRTVTFPNHTSVETTCLQRGGFDLLAVNGFAFDQTWRFMYARNSDLPSSTFRWYTPYQRQYLLASSVPVSWPPRPPFYADPLPVLQAIVRDRKR